MRHIDSKLHVTGQSLYVDDEPPPADLLHGAVFASPVAHGKLISIDLAEARKCPGVTAVFSYKDIPGNPMIGPVFQDEPLFASDTVMFQGHQIALVVANTPEIARKAVKLCKAEIEPLPVVTCPKDAFNKGLLLQEPRIYEKGDVDSAWEKCDLIVEGKIDLGGQEHLYLETNRARAIPTEDGQIKVFSSTQSPSAGQKFIARILGIPMHKVEVDVKRIGGGFGGKEDQATHWACMAALAAVKLKKPVQIVLNRIDDMRMTGKRHPYKQDYKLGLDTEGNILAFEVDHYQNSGAFMDLSAPVLERSVVHSTNAYAKHNVRIRAAACRTNLPPNTAFRGFGGPQGMFPIEVAIDLAAGKMNVSPQWIQERNLISRGYVMHYGQEIEDNRLKRCWQVLEAKYSFTEARKRIDLYNAGSFSRKKGMAVMPVCFGISFTKTFLNQGSSLVHVYTDGSVSVATGGIEMGQGVSSNMAAIAARTFGINPERVRVNSTNTSRIANISPSAASATTDLNGNATIIACREIHDTIILTASEELSSANPEDISIVDETVYLKGQPTDLRWDEIVLKTYLSRRALMAHGFYTPPEINFDPVKGKGKPFHYYSYGACYIEVTVDCIRGTYTIDRACITHDLGRTIIPSVDLGQIEGGLAQGIGWMTIEELAYDEEGKLLSQALSTYKAPDANALPDEIAVNFLENVDNPGGPLGSKAVGEPPLMYGIAAYFALKNAIHAYNPAQVSETKAPMTPERVLQLLYQNRKLRLRPQVSTQA